MNNDQNKTKPGFTLIECLISLSLFTILILACLEFFSNTRILFVKLKDRFQISESIFFTLDRIRLDLHCGGQGLLIPIDLGILEPINVTPEHISVFSSDKKIELKAALVPGQTYIQLENIKELKKNRLICIFDSQHGEIKTISGIDSTGISLSTQLENHYHPDTASLLLLRTVSFYLDESNCILRRKINNSPAQPLLEDVRKINFSYDLEVNKLIHISIQMNGKEEKFYEITIIPKNSMLVSINPKDLQTG